MGIHKIACTIGIGLLFLFPVIGQDEETTGTDTAPGEDNGAFTFSMEIELGAQTFNEDGGETTTYQNIGLYPEFAFGKVGIGLGIDLNYRFVDDQGDSNFEVREDDWIPHGDRNFLDIYLPIFRYVRYGEKGDPLYGKIGSIEEGTLGNGFIMGNYTNTLFLPERRHVGLAFDVDGDFFDFPYLGMETFVGNLAQFDVMGTRVYARPLVNTDLSLLKELQVGTTVAADTKPNAIYNFVEDPETESTYSPNSVKMFSVDFFQPVFASPSLSAALYGDAAFQPGGDTTSNGGLVGFGGKIVNFINYSLNTLLLGDNFVPFYFDATYDLYRQEKYEIYSGKRDISGYAGWLASLGFGFLEDTVVFNTSVNSAFSPQSGKDSTYPHIRSTFSVGEGVLPGVYFDLTYDKKYIKEFSDFGEPENSLIGANIHYRAGIAVINLGYTLRYVPAEEDWETTAKLSTSISL